MKLKFVAVCILLGSCAVVQAQEGSRPVAQPGNFALGVQLGAPTGLTGKYWLDRRNAVDFGFGTPFDSDVRFGIHSDYLFQVPLNARVPGEMPLYLGLGARLRALDEPKGGDTVDFGMRLPLGLEFMPASLPLDFFAELAPVLVFVPKGRLSLDGAVGVRYRF